VAWTEQAWRYSLAGIPDPSQSLDEPQIHTALAGVTISSTPLAPYTWTQEDRYAIHYIPDPDQGFITITRSAIGTSPWLDFPESTDRDGDIDAVMSGFAADFDGTVDNTSASRDGDLTTTVAGFAASIVGDFVYRHYFDIAYSVTPTWTVTEQPANFGDVDITLGGYSTAFVGFAIPPDSTQGLISSVMSGFSPDFDGTVTLPPSFDGDIQADIEAFGVTLTGTATPAGSFLGQIDTTLGGYSLAFTGDFAVWNTDGDIGFTLGQFSPTLAGQFIPAGAITGELMSDIGSFGVSITGSFITDVGIERIKMVVDTDDTARMKVDTDATAKMKV